MVHQRCQFSQMFRHSTSNTPSMSTTIKVWGGVALNVIEEFDGCKKSELLQTLVYGICDEQVRFMFSGLPSDKLRDYLTSLSPDELEDCLCSAPADSIFPKADPSLPLFKPDMLDDAVHFVKRPSIFRWATTDYRGTVIADDLAAEAMLYKKLQASTHPNLSTFHGVIVEYGRLTGIVLDRYQFSLAEKMRHDLEPNDPDICCNQVKEAVNHLHSLNIAHNDIHPNNIMFRQHWVLIDLSSCQYFGEPLKHIGDPCWSSGLNSKSDPGNDHWALETLHHHLKLELEAAE